MHARSASYLVSAHVFFTFHADEIPHERETIRYCTPCGTQAVEDDGRGLVDTVMDLLGIDPSAIGENDNLAGMGIDSMQARSQLN